MPDFDFAQIQSNLPKSNHLRPNFASIFPNFVSIFPKSNQFALKKFGRR